MKSDLVLVVGALGAQGHVAAVHPGPWGTDWGNNHLSVAWLTRRVPQIGGDRTESRTFNTNVIYKSGCGEFIKLI